MWICPVCGKRGVGKIGVDQYYCMDCCSEFEYKNHRLKTYQVQDDGTLLAIHVDEAQIHSCFA